MKIKDKLNLMKQVEQNNQQHLTELEIRDAMYSLGITKGTVKVVFLDQDRVQVFLNGKLFGIYDSVKHTFVD